MSSRVFHLLIVDDDPLIHQSFRLCLPKHWRPISATSLKEIPETRSFHAAFVDMHLSGTATPDGLDVLRSLQKDRPTMDLIAMSGDVRRDLMESALRAGAQRFLAKPLQSEELLLILEKLEALWDLRQGALRREGGAAWIGEGISSQNVLKKIASLKGETAPILIEGESGTGKEVVARLLVQQEEAERPFVPVNIAALTENLFESELFGHVKGAFTGADRDKVGLIEAADGGDLFLDEIEAMPLAQQVKLLRFLESGEIRRVGASSPTHVRCRVIAAGNRSLETMVQEGTFREDLYYRLAGQRIILPPLRERSEDIGLLVKHFLDAERPRRNKSFTDDGITAMKAYSWPGNVRELRRICERLSLTSPLPLIRGEDVAVALTSNRTNAKNEMDLSRGLAPLVDEFEKSVLQKALEREKDVEKTATLLGISRSNLYKKMKDHGLESNG